MLRIFATVVVLASLAPALAPTAAQARDGGAVAAGVLGGLAAGAIIGSAVANPRPAPPPVYYAPPPPPPTVIEEEDCYYERSRVWDPYSGTWRRGPRRMVCD